VPIADAILMPLAAAGTIPAVTYAAEAGAALLPPRRAAAPPGHPPRFVVLVPAHDEAGTIGGTVASLRGDLGPTGRILVVADNCSDATAAEARAAGAEVTERRDPSRRGKGYALSHGVETLASDPPEAVVVVDADCRVSAGGLARLAAHCVALGRPVQARYLLEAPPEAAPARRVSAFAVLVKNHLRLRGLDRLGLPAVLTGSGMAFPWPLLRDAPETRGEIVEDLVLGLTLSARGTPPAFLEDVLITSPLPLAGEAAQSQRRRWEHGYLAALGGHVPTLLAAGVRRRDPRLVASALDLAVPPQALLVGGLASGSAVSGLAAATGLATPAPFLLFTGSLATVMGSTGVLWLAFGRETLPAGDLAALGAYLADKLPLYGSWLRGARETRWVRTARDPRPGADGRGEDPGDRGGRGATAGSRRFR